MAIASQLPPDQQPPVCDLRARPERLHGCNVPTLDPRQFSAQKALPLLIRVTFGYLVVREKRGESLSHSSGPGSGRGRLDSLRATTACSVF